MSDLVVERSDGILLEVANAGHFKEPKTSSKGSDEQLDSPEGQLSVSGLIARLNSRSPISGSPEPSDLLLIQNTKADLLKQHLNGCGSINLSTFKPNSGIQTTNTTTFGKSHQNNTDDGANHIKNQLRCQSQTIGQQQQQQQQTSAQAAIANSANQISSKAKNLIQSQGHLLLSNKLIDRNSLESIDSRDSNSSSANDLEDVNGNRLEWLPQQRTHSVKAIGLSAQRGHVSPPELATAKLQSLACDLSLVPGKQADGSPLCRAEELNSSLGSSRSASRQSSKRPIQDKYQAPIRGNGHRDNDEHSDDSTSVTVVGGKRPAQTSGGLHPMKREKPPFMFAGIVASILGSIFFSSSILCVKLLPNSDSLQGKTTAICFRGVIMVILCAVSIISQKSTFKVERNEILVTFLRAVFGYLGVMGAYLALSYISMGDSTALVFSSPVWTSLLSHFILKEPLQWVQLLALPASLFGIVLIAHPALILPVEHLPAVGQLDSLAGSNHSGLPMDMLVARADDLLFPLVGDDADQDNNSILAMMAANATGGADVDPLLPSAFDFRHRWPGIAIALCTSLMVSCVYIVLKFRKTTPIQTTTFYLGVFTVGASLLLMTVTGFGHFPDTLSEWALVLGNGLFSWLGQSVLQWAFFYEDASILSVVRTLDVAMSFILSAIFLRDEIYWTSIVGAVIIGLVVVSIMLNNWILSLAVQRRSPTPSSTSAATSAPLATATPDDPRIQVDHQIRIPTAQAPDVKKC